MNNQNESSNFRLSTKTLFFTYPKSNNISKDSIVKEIQNIIRYKFKDRKVNWIIASEERRDSYDFRHIIFELNRKVDTKIKQSTFDIQGTHGNYQSVRNKRKTINYIRREATLIYVLRIPIDLMSRADLTSFEWNLEAGLIYVCILDLMSIVGIPFVVT